MAVTFEVVKGLASLREYARENLQPVGRSFVCPCCGSGTGPHKTPAFTITGDHWHCYSCDNGGDIFDLCGVLNGTDDKSKQLHIVAEWVGVADEAPSEARRKPERTDIATKPKQPEKSYSEGRERERRYIEESRGHLADQESVSYLDSRGIGIDLARAWGLGYDPKARRVIIPWLGSDYYHVDRDVTGQQPHKYLKPSAAKVGPQPLYNPDALKEPAFFVVEGVLDALAIGSCGQQAVALGSTSDAGGRLVEAMRGAGRGHIALIMLDRDKHGREGAAKLFDAMKDAGVDGVVVEAPSHIPGKDAAAMLTTDPERLTAWAAQMVAEARDKVSEAEEADYLAALEHMRVLDPAVVALELYTLADATPPIPTGFALLDEVLNGGLQAALYVLGAVSSLGKTTFSLQLADRIASTGRSVLFVSVEQSARELVAKSLSRMMREASDGRPFTTATAGEIMNPVERERWMDRQIEAFDAACERYSAEVAPHLRIFEGREQPSVSDIRTVAERMARHDGQAPFVCVDYLQLLAPQSEHDSDKQSVDKNVMALRQLARDLKAPVLAISSLNRSSYSGSVDLASFKESGAIEYGSDVLLGLQPRGIADVECTSNDREAKTAAKRLMREHKDEFDRPCELMVLKNRNGRTPSDGLPFTFHALHGLFEES